MGCDQWWLGARIGHRLSEMSIQYQVGMRAPVERNAVALKRAMTRNAVCLICTSQHTSLLIEFEWKGCTDLRHS